MRDVAKNDKLCPQESLPLCSSLAAAGRRLVDGLGPHAEHRGQGPPGVAEDLHPEVGDPIPCPGDGRAAAPRLELGGGDAEAPAHAGDERGEREGAGARAAPGLHRLPEALDEGTAPQDALVAEVGLAAPAEGGHGGPPAQAAHQPAALEVGAPALREPGPHEGAVGPAGRASRPGELGEDLPRGLPGSGDGPQEGAVAGPGVPGERPEVRDHPRPDRVQVEVADELQEVRFGLHHDRLVPVLEEVPDPPVAAIEGPPHGGVRKD